MKNDKDIAVILHTTFTRWPLAVRTIASFEKNSRFQLYISDTGELTPRKLEDYQALHDMGHKIFHLGWDTSPAITRNFLMDHVEEPYFFKIDDDFEYGDKVNEQDAIEVLKSSDEIGLAGMSVRSAKYKSQFIFDAHRMDQKGGDVMKLDAPDRRPEKHKGIRYLPCDITPDCWIAKRSIFPECAWDERYHVSEGLHTDFFLHIKYNTPYAVVYMPDCIMYTFKHDKDYEVPDEKKKGSFYHKKRFRNLNNIEQFCKKWKVKEINRW